MLNRYRLFCWSRTGRGLSGGVFVPRLARRVAAESRGGGPRRTGADHRVGRVAVAAARGRAVAVVAASRLRDHATSRTRHQTHVVATGPDAGLQGPHARDDGAVHVARAGRLGRRAGHHLQPSAVRRRSRRRAANHRVRTVVVVVSGRRSARLARRRHHHQESRPRPDTRYTVTVGGQVGATRRVAPSHGKRYRFMCFKRF